jgi:hypothetical protein
MLKQAFDMTICVFVSFALINPNICSRAGIFLLNRTLPCALDDMIKKALAHKLQVSSKQSELTIDEKHRITLS